MLNLESILIDVAVIVEVQTQKPKFGERQSRNWLASSLPRHQASATVEAR
jgi:hypothetical protein